MFKKLQAYICLCEWELTMKYEQNGINKYNGNSNIQWHILTHLQQTNKRMLLSSGSHSVWQFSLPPWPMQKHQARKTRWVADVFLWFQAYCGIPGDRAADPADPLSWSKRKLGQNGTKYGYRKEDLHQLWSLEPKRMKVICYQERSSYYQVIL